jgi:hypothetical protein
MELSQRELATILAALEFWKEELDEGEAWMSQSLFFSACLPLSAEEIDQLAERLESKEAVDARSARRI